MIYTVKSSLQFGDHADQRPAPQQQEGGVLEKRRGKYVAEQPDLRLMIEHDEAGGLIYKLINRANGEVVAEMSREDLLKMSENPSYTAGALFSTKA